MSDCKRWKGWIYEITGELAVVLGGNVGGRAIAHCDQVGANLA